MKKVLPVLFALSVLSLYACDDSQDSEINDSSLIDLDIHVLVNDESHGFINVQALSPFVTTIQAEGEEQQGVKISDIIQAVNQIPANELNDYLADYVCDYESADGGFRPSSKGDRCPMVSCSYATQSYVNVVSGSLFYDDSAPMKTGCYHVKNVTKVLMYKNAIVQ